MGIPAPIKKVWSLLKPLLFSDLFLLLVIIIVMYIQVRYNKIENEILMSSVQSFVFSAMNETKMEVAADLNRFYNGSSRRPPPQQQQQGSPRQMKGGDMIASSPEEWMMTQRSGSNPPRQQSVPAFSAASAMRSRNDFLEDEGEMILEEDDTGEDEDVNDEIRYLFRCISSGVPVTNAKKHDEDVVKVTEIIEEGDNDKTTDGKEEEGKQQPPPPQPQQESRTEEDTVGNSGNSEKKQGDAAAENNDAGHNDTKVDRHHDDANAPPPSDLFAVQLAYLQRMKVPELKKIATDLNIDTKGTKETLIGRIHEWQKQKQQ